MRTNEQDGSGDDPALTDCPHEKCLRLVEENNRLRKSVHRLESEVLELRAQLSDGRFQHGGEVVGTDALRWQIADVLIGGLAKPGWRTVRMPDRLFRLLWKAYRHRQRKSS